MGHGFDMKLGHIAHIHHWKRNIRHHGHFTAKHLTKKVHRLPRNIAPKWRAKNAARIDYDQFNFIIARLHIHKIPCCFFGECLALKIGAHFGFVDIGPIIGTHGSRFLIAHNCSHLAR